MDGGRARKPSIHGRRMLKSVYTTRVYLPVCLLPCIYHPGIPPCICLPTYLPGYTSLYASLASLCRRVCLPVCLPIYASLLPVYPGVYASLHSLGEREAPESLFRVSGRQRRLLGTGNINPGGCHFLHFLVRKLRIRRPGAGCLPGCESPVLACCNLKGGLRALPEGF